MIYLVFIMREKTDDITSYLQVLKEWISGGRDNLLKY